MIDALTHARDAIKVYVEVASPAPRHAEQAAATAAAGR